MTSHVYLLKNGEIYNIGWTNNLQKTLSKLKPADLLASLQTNEPASVYRNLVQGYQKQRLPNSDYFLLSRAQAQNCKSILESTDGTKYFQPFFTGIRLVVAFLLAWICFSGAIIKFAIQPIFDRLL